MNFYCFSGNLHEESSNFLRNKGNKMSLLPHVKIK